jgi:V/A-type H+/Na+-transporting ATPase subunit F
MEILVIGHPEAVLGFSLVGVHGQTATSAEEANHVLDSALASLDVGIILVTNDVAKLIEPRMAQLKLRSTIPLVIEIPGPEGVPSDQQSLSEVVQQVIGIKI